MFGVSAAISSASTPSPATPHVVAPTAERSRGQTPHLGIVLDEQDRPPFWPTDGTAHGLGSSWFVAGVQRKPDVEARPLAGSCAYLDAPTALFDDPVAGREPQTRSLPDILGREEGFEDVRQDVLGNPGALVFDAQARPGSRLHLRTGRIAERGPVDRDRDRSALGHRVARVHHEVDEDLLELAGVDEDAHVFRPVGDRQLDVLADQATQHRGEVARHLEQRRRSRHHDLTTGQCEQLTGEARRVFGGDPDLGQRRVQRRVGLGFQTREVEVPEDRGQDVVEVVGHATGEATHRFHLLDLQQLRLQAFVLAQISCDQRHDRHLVGGHRRVQQHDARNGDGQLSGGADVALADPDVVREALVSLSRVLHPGREQGLRGDLPVDAGASGKCARAAWFA